MGIRSHQAAAVADDNIVAIGRRIIALRNRAGLCRQYRAAARGRDIGALMELARAVNGMGTPAIATARAAGGRRPDEAADARRSGIGAARTAATAAVRRRLLLFARRFLSRFPGRLGFPAGNLRDLVADALLLVRQLVVFLLRLILIALCLLYTSDAADE